MTNQNEPVGTALESLVAQWRKDAAELNTSDNTLCQKVANCTMRHAAELEAALAARQPVGEPVAYTDGNEFVCAAEYATMRGLGHDGNGWRPLYAAPPAQAVDLEQFRQPVQDWLDDAQASMEEHGDYDGVFGHAIEEGTRLLALIDSHGGK